jgi:Skp family chaperone for outer membrane proteins
MDINAATPGTAPAQTAAEPSGNVQETRGAGSQGNTGLSNLNATESTGGGTDDLDVSLDELIGADFGDDPIMNGTHKGIPDYRKILEHIPENGKKLVQNLRSSYTQKTQEIAQVRRELEAEKAELARQRALLSESDFARNVRELATKQPEHDAWSDEGLQERINLQAAKMMQEMLTPLQQDLEAQRRQVSLDTFKSQHPDLTSDEIRMPVAQLLMSRPELKLEDAYYIVRGQITKQENEQARKIQKEALLKTSTGNAVRNAAPPKFKDAWQAYQWHKANGGK